MGWGKVWAWWACATSSAQAKLSPSLPTSRRASWSGASTCEGEPCPHSTPKTNCAASAGAAVALDAPFDVEPIQEVMFNNLLCTMVGVGAWWLQQHAMCGVLQPSVRWPSAHLHFSLS